MMLVRPLMIHFIAFHRPLVPIPAMEVPSGGDGPFNRHFSENTGHQQVAAAKTNGKLSQS